MFKKRVLPVLLSLALTATAALPVVYAVESSGEAEAEQPVPQTVNFTNAGPFLPVTLAEEQGDGLELSKTVTLNDKDGYTINLEAYTTGTVTSVDTTKPVDIVLVLDVSGSMDYCINCGRERSQHHRNSCDNGHYEYTYEPIYDINNGGTYYYRDGSEYKQAFYCRGNSSLWDKCEGGWFSQQHGGLRGHNGKKLIPRTSVDDTDGTQFYSRSSGEWVPATQFESRIDALKNAVNTFVNNVRKSAAGSDGMFGTDDDVKHRISIVKFSGEIRRDRWSELVVGNDTYRSGGNTWNYTQPITDLLDMQYDENSTQIIEAVNSIEPAGGTRSDYGMQVASEIMEEARSENNYDRNQVAIMFTDGEPTKSNEFSDEVANDAISAAAEIKNYDKATVYTVGVFNGADGTVPNSPDDMDRDGYDKTNRYMHLVSSNFPDATGYSHYEGWGQKDQWGGLNSSLEDGESYYLSASDSESLNDIFETISDNISSSMVDLGAESVVRDIVTPQFVMPQNADDIHVDIMDAQYTDGELRWETSSYKPKIQVTIDPRSRAVNVTGFDFKHNFVAENGRNEVNPKEDGDFHGRKLVISFDVTVAPGFFGGNDVLTNGSGSGVYENADEPNAFKEFNYPKVNIPIQYKVPDTAEEIFSGEKPNLSGKSIDYARGFKPDGFNNKYVDIIYELIDPAGKTVGIFKILAGETEGKWTDEPNVDPLYENTTYKIKWTVFPSSDGEKADVGKPATAKMDNAKHVVTVLNGTLTITKAMAQGTNADSGERFVFNIYKDNMNDPYMTVAVEAGKSVTINNLPAGTYTVEEDTSWSWRFKSQLTDGGIVTIDAKNPTAKVTCMNGRENEQWLNKYDWAVNHQKDGGYVENTGGSEAQ